MPAVLHASITNLLVFHKFLERNVNYIAHTKSGNEEPQPDTAPIAPELDTIDADDEKADNDASVDLGPVTAGDWGLTFPTLTEAELMSGLVVQERVVKLLDHPGLTNHLLRARNLLPLLVSGAPRHVEPMAHLGRAGKAITSCVTVEPYLVHSDE